MKQFGKEMPKTRLTAIGNAGKALGISEYKVLKLVTLGRLEIEKVDNGIRVVTKSIERLQKELAA
jgi:hypothetical protein